MKRVLQVKRVARSRKEDIRERDRRLTSRLPAMPRAASVCHDTSAHNHHTTPSSSGRSGLWMTFSFCVCSKLACP